MKIITLFCLILFLNLTPFFYAQDIEWGPLTECEKYLPKKITDNEGGYYSYHGGKLEYFEVGSKTPMSSSQFESKFENARIIDERSDVFNNEFILVMISEQKIKKQIFYRKFGTDCNPIGENVLVGECSPESGVRNVNEAKLLKSENGQFFCIEYCVPALNSEDPKFGYKIYDVNMKVVNEGYFDLPYSMHQTVLTNHYLSNSGKLYLASKTYDNIENSLNVRKDRIYREFSISQVDGDGLETLDLNTTDLDIKTKNITDISFQVDGNDLMIANGVFLSTPDKKRGACFFKINLDKKTVLAQDYKEYISEFNCGSAIVAENYFSHTLRKLIANNDGSYFVIFEQVEIRNSKEPPSTNYHNYNIIAYKINSSGKFEWVNVIPKTQISSQDFGYFNGFDGYQKDDKFLLLFNDNPENYDASNNFFASKKGYKPTTVTLTVGNSTNVIVKMCLVIVEVNMSTGEYTRKPLVISEIEKMYFVPTRFQENKDQKEVYLNFQTANSKEEKIGIIKL